MSKEFRLVKGYVPIDDAKDFLEFLKPDINMISDTITLKRKTSLLRLYEIFVTPSFQFQQNILCQTLLSIHKQLFMGLFDSNDKCKELVLEIIIQLFKKAGDFSLTLDHLIPILVDKLGAKNIEGTEHLPEDIKPSPSQAPHLVKNPPEKSEEVRKKIAELVNVIVMFTSTESIRFIVNDLVNILRCLAMDPCAEIIEEGCNCIINISKTATEILFHFSEILGRSLFAALVHKHSKIRIIGLESLRNVMYIGVYKYNMDIIHHLVGFRDPNLVPIKDFYESSIKYNYFAHFVKDPNNAVRSAFYKVIIDWMKNLPDKRDLEGSLVPYILSGLFDGIEDIEKMVYEQMEEIGKIYEIENEKDLRDAKQWDFQSPWTQEGKMAYLSLPPPFERRPRLGCRIIIRNYVRRFIIAICKELDDWIEDTRERAVNLLLCTIVYTEDFLTQYFDKIMLPLFKIIMTTSNKIIQNKLPICIRLLGRYITQETYIKIISAGINYDLQSEHQYSVDGALKFFPLLLTGSIDIIKEGDSILIIENSLKIGLDLIKAQILDRITKVECQIAIESIELIIGHIDGKSATIIDIPKLLEEFDQIIFDILFSSLASALNYLSDQQEYNQLLEKVKLIWKKIADLSNLKVQCQVDDYISSHISHIVKKLSESDFDNSTRVSNNSKLLVLIIKSFSNEKLRFTINNEKEFDPKFYNELNIMILFIFKNITTKCVDPSFLLASLDLLYHHIKSISKISEEMFSLIIELFIGTINRNLEAKLLTNSRSKLLSVLYLILNSKETFLKASDVNSLLKDLIELAKDQDYEIRKLSNEIIHFICKEEDAKPKFKVAYYNELVNLFLKLIWDKVDKIREIVSDTFYIVIKINLKNYQAIHNDFIKNTAPLLLTNSAKIDPNCTDFIKNVAESEKETLKSVISDMNEFLNETIIYVLDCKGKSQEKVKEIIFMMSKKFPVIFIHKWILSKEEGYENRKTFLGEIVMKILMNIMSE